MKMPHAGLLFALICLALSSQPSAADIPQTITLQGTLASPSGDPLTGQHVYRVRLYDAGFGGAQLQELSGTAELSEQGRFSINLGPSPAALAAGQLWYDLAIDSGDDGITAEDEFPNRVRFHSVPFALISANAEQLGGAPAAAYIHSGSVAAEAWGLSGNTVSGAEYLGTRNNQTLVLKVNDLAAFRVIPDATSPNILGGHPSNTIDSGVSGGTIAGGGWTGIDRNRVSADYGTIGGGSRNLVSGTHGVIAGGWTNLVSASRATVAGGESNTASGSFSSMGGGYTNSATADYSTIAGGYVNQTHGVGSSIGGGFTNLAKGSYAVVGGGIHNKAASSRSAVAGGDANEATNTLTFVGGGFSNLASGSNSTVTGGFNNEASGISSAVAGGSSNQATATHSFVGGGDENLASGEKGVVTGGSDNAASGISSAVAGGSGNQATATHSFVGGGDENLASGEYATVGGGRDNTASGDYSCVPGGRDNTASAFGSFAIGRGAKAVHDGSFVWADAAGVGDTQSTASNQFLIRARNGLRLVHDAGESKPVSYRDRFGDNGLVAWAKISGGGTISVEFGVVSVEHTADSGIYAITLDATAAEAAALIPMAAAEIDTAPANADQVRITSINQRTATEFDVFINRGSGALVDNDFVFMVTGRGHI